MFHWEVSPSVAWRETCSDRNPAPLMKIQAQWHLRCALLGTSTKRTAQHNVNENIWVTGQHLPHSSWQPRTPLYSRRGWLMAPKVFPERKLISHCRDSELKYDAQSKHSKTALRIYLSNTRCTLQCCISLKLQIQPSYCGGLEYVFFPKQLSHVLSCQPTSGPLTATLFEFILSLNHNSTRQRLAEVTQSTG